MSEVPSRSEVWQTFRGMNLTPYHQSKNNLTYIPWSRAWASAMDAFGDHLSIKWHGMTDKDGVTLDHIRYADETATVCCSAWFGGEWDDAMTKYGATETPKKAKAKKKAKAPAPEESYEEAERIALDKPEDPVAVREKLSSVCKALYAADWEADETLQARIRTSVKSNDVAEMTALITLLEDVLPATLTLHKES